MFFSYRLGGGQMEKENMMTALMDLDNAAMLDCIVESAREAAGKIPVFAKTGNGCIRVTMVPLCQRADEWLGGGSKCDDAGFILDVCEYERVYKISPTGSHTILYTCDDEHVEPVNCYGYSALKTAYASRLRKFGFQRRDDKEAIESGYFCEENGWSTHFGSTVMTVSYVNSNTDEHADLMRIYICVSGAESHVVHACASFDMMKLILFFTQSSENFKCVVFNAGEEPK